MRPFVSRRQLPIIRWMIVMVALPGKVSYQPALALAGEAGSVQALGSVLRRAEDWWLRLHVVGFREVDNAGPRLGSGCCARASVRR
jgi:hypothetical protein